MPISYLVDVKDPIRVWAVRCSIHRCKTRTCRGQGVTSSLLKSTSHEAPQNSAAPLTNLISLSGPVSNFRGRLEWQGRTKHLICRQRCKHSSFMRGYRGTTGCKLKLLLQCRKALLNMHAGQARVLRGAVSSWSTSWCPLSINRHLSLIFHSQRAFQQRELIFLRKFYIQLYPSRFA